MMDVREMRRRGQRVRVPVWEHVGEVASFTNPDERYEIKRRRADGHLGCACLGYRFKKGEKTCKHTQAFALGRHADVAKPVVVTVAQEQFTVRRAISFGALD
jgi:hypothetical protein